MGVLSCEDDVLCMRFYYDCVTGLESKASRIALLHSRLWTPCAAVSGGATTAQGVQAAPARAFPRFQFQVISRRVAKAFSTWHKKAAGKHGIRRGMGMGPCCPGTEGRPDKLLQRRVTFPFPGLPSQEPGPRQQDVGKKPSASVLPQCPGSSPRTKEAGRQEPAPPARRTAALPSSEGCKRALQALGTGGTWTPHPPAQPRRKEVSERWRKAENPLPAEQMAAAAQQERLQPDHLSPRAVQVLRRLEPHQMQRRTFKHVAENNKRRQEQQRQLPCARCWYHSRGEGAGSGGSSSGC
ncbi:uncharacterized protein LJ206_001827 isoform 3-T3 [Theristicus caerulescens]